MTQRKYSHSPYFYAKKAALDEIRATGKIPGSSRLSVVKRNGCLQLMLDGKASSDKVVAKFPAPKKFSRKRCGRQAKCDLYTIAERVELFGKIELKQTMGLLRRVARHSPEKLFLGGSVRPLGSFEHDVGMLVFAGLVDCGWSLVRDIQTLRDPEARAALKTEYARKLRMMRRPYYYESERQRRRLLAAERRKITRRTTTAPCPTPAQILAAWNARKESKEAMLRLGGLLDDLACYVDSALRITECGDIIGRNGGILGWLTENLRELEPKYKSLMRYKALAKKFRQATGTHDPTPVSAALELDAENIRELLKGEEKTFVSLERAIMFRIDPEMVGYLDEPKYARRVRRRLDG